MKINELKENKCIQAALAVLFSVLLCLLAFLLDNRGILSLPGEERGIRQVSGEVTEEGTRIDLSGGYVDRLSFAISGEIRVKPSAEEDWITFPVGSRTRKSEPTLSSDSTSMVPWCSSTMCLESARPMPTLFWAAALFEA